MMISTTVGIIQHEGEELDPLELQSEFIENGVKKHMQDYDQVSRSSNAT